MVKQILLQERLQSLSHLPSVDADDMYDMINPLDEKTRVFCSLHAAVKIGLFDKIEETNEKKHIVTSYPYPHLISGLIEVLKNEEYIREKNGYLKNNPIVSLYFTQSSPFFQGPFLEKLMRHIRDLWLNLPEIILKGPKQYDEEEFFSKISLPSMASNALTGRLQLIIQKITSLDGFSEFKKMADLGGGHGLYAIAIASLLPNLKAEVFDLPNVIPLTEKYIHDYQMEKQVSTIGGDFFVIEIGSGFDLIFSSSNPSGKSIEFISKVNNSLNKGGYFINVQPGDFDPNNKPVQDLEWELWTFDRTKSGKKAWGKKKKFATPEYLENLEEHGFEILSIHQIPDPYIKNYAVNMIIARKK